MKSAACLALAALALGAASRTRAEEFTFEQLTARAKALAAQPYAARPSPVPTDLRKLNYDQYRDIRFRPSASWWFSTRAMIVRVEASAVLLSVWA